MKIIEPDSAFKLLCSFTLSSTDQEVLSLLYLPIIKSDAFSLYHYFLSLKSVDYSYIYHDDALKNLGFDESKFLNARSALEGIGLLESFRKKEIKDDNKILYFYKLLPPANPKKFFSDVLFTNLLSTLIGKKRFFEVFNHFKIKDEFDEKQFIDYTSQFKDVYLHQIKATGVISSDDTEELADKDYKKVAAFTSEELKKRIQINNYQFIISEDLLNKVTDTCILYGIDLEKCLQLLSKNTDSDGKIYFDRFVDDCRLINNYITESSESSKELSNDSKANQLISVLTTITPQYFLQIKFNIKKLPPYIYEEIEKLKSDFNLPNSLINVILDYSIRKTNNRFNSLFIDKVALTIKSAKIVEPYEAMVFLNSSDFNAIKKKRTKSVSKKKLSENEIEVSENDISAIKDMMNL